MASFEIIDMSVADCWRVRGFGGGCDVLGMAPVDGVGGG